MDDTGLRGSMAAARLRPEIARAVFNGVVNTCGRLRPAALLPRLGHLPQCVMNGLAGYKGSLAFKRRRARPEYLVVYLHTGW